MDKITDNHFFIGLVIFAFIFPLIYVIIIDSNLYSGIRQMLFILPLLGILSAIGIAKTFERFLFAYKYSIYPAVIVIFLLAFLPLKHQAATFPVDYVYFNSISGGNRKAWSNFEYDYYFHGIKESAKYLKNLAGDEDITIVINCNLDNYFEDYSNIKVDYSRYLERSSKVWDYGIFGVNYLHPFMLKNDTWQSAQIIKTFYHKGNPLTVILKRNDLKDFEGITEIENGKYLKGKNLLKQAIQKEPKNIWLYVHIAKANLMTDNIDDFHKNIEKGRQINPYYEPFFMLEAQYLYNENRYKESAEVLERLLDINPMYSNASKLMDEIEKILKK